MLVAAAIIGVDVALEKRGSAFRTPVLAVAVGIYLPLELSVAIFLGGIIAWAAARYYQTPPIRTRLQARLTATQEVGDRNGLLFAAGLITGEALMGILLALPIVITGRADALALWGTHEGTLPGVILLALVMFLLYRVITIEAKRAEAPR
jgi:uncharacterized oligopeptide transporter (OPT) family protein